MIDIQHYDELCALGEKLIFPKGTNLSEYFSRGMDPFVLDSGICALSNMTEEGARRTQTYFAAPWLINIVPIHLQDGRDSFAAGQFLELYSKTDCTLYRIPAEKYEALLVQRPLLGRSVMQILAYNIDLAYSTLFDSYDLPAFLRLCKALLRLDRPDGIAPFFTAEELGSFVGVHSVTVLKIIAELKRREIVGRRGGRLYIDDRPHLSRLVKQRIVYDY